jgi:LCP family protein required for cell wall assembly
MTVDRDDGDDVPERDDDAPLDEAGEAADEPQPATWAGRQGWKGLPDEPDAEAGELEDDEPQDDEPEDEPAGAEDPELTREADTLAVADQEEAREAALAGLRARTAEHAAKRGVTDPGPGADGDREAEGDADEPDAEAVEDDATVVAASAGAEGPPPTDEVPADQAKAPRHWLWARFLTASFVIIVSMATATSISLLVYLTDIARGLGGIPKIDNQLTDVEGGKPQNFLILGSDVRPDEPGKGRSDTTILLRVDPETDVISQLSIPRDLKVNIPGQGIDKFNAAYTYGGPKLTLKVMNQITESRIPINHVVNVDFNGFADAVNAIDCVYVDVDRHYLNTNEGLGFAEQYAEIDIQAGYQRLCGFKALQYVRYRHEDNDLVRAARQQSFLREARQRVPASTLLDERDELIDIFTKYTDSDIQETAQLVDLFKLMIGARGAQINRIEFRTTSLGDESGYVTASDDGIRAAVSEFLGEGVPTPEADPEQDRDADDKKPRGGEGKPTPDPKQAPPAPATELIDSTDSGGLYSTTLAQSAGKKLKFPVLYPARLAPGSMISDSDTREFPIDGPGKEIYRGYKFVISRQGSTYPTAYYGVSGTDWVDAPLFANASDERQVNGRTYRLYYDTGSLRMVAFQRADAMYWVTNTLDNLLSNEEMLGIAQNLAVPGG